MDRIILTTQDVETLLKWRDNNAELVRRNSAPFKGIVLEFPETNIIIKAYNDAGKIAFYIQVNGEKAGKITGRQLPGGFFKARKNTTKLKSDDVQSIITVYASLMAFIVYRDPTPAAAAAERRQDRQHKKRGKGKKQQCCKAVSQKEIYLGSHACVGCYLRPHE